MRFQRLCKMSKIIIPAVAVDPATAIYEEADGWPQTIASGVTTPCRFLALIGSSLMWPSQGGRRRVSGRDQAHHP
jgi:hypothetical protein